MTLEEKYDSIVQKFRVEANHAVDEAISSVHSEMLPHIDSDTDFNVSYRADSVIRNMLSGNFKVVDENTVYVNDDNGVSTKIELSASQYNKVRKQLIEVMPACPKDLEIENLKHQLEQARKLV